MKNLSAVYFSPTGGTRKAVLNLAAGMGGDIEEVDLCALKGERGFGPEDLVIVGMPVFGGRIPGFAAKLLKQCRGNGATAVTVAVYGNVSGRYPKDSRLGQAPPFWPSIPWQGRLRQDARIKRTKRMPADLQEKSWRSWQGMAGRNLRSRETGLTAAGSRCRLCPLQMIPA